MDKHVTVRFYTVDRHSQAVPALRGVLEQISEIERASDRERLLAVDFSARLERLDMEPAGNYLCGEMTRVQRTNYPSEVTDQGTEPLDVDNPLGHGVAFCYHPESGVLAMQFDARVLSPGRFMDYLAMAFDGAIYVLDPILKQDSWQRFNDNPIKKVRLGIASPSLVAALEHEEDAAATVFRDLAQMYDAPVINVDIGVGHMNRTLNERVKGSMRWLLEKEEDGVVDVRTAKAWTESEGAGSSDEINLLDDLFSFKDELALPDNDPEQSYEVRKTHVLNLSRRYAARG